ncbi:scaffolding protein [Gordonia phage BiPauneto]|nr:scaffolding protein [Gordonia phage BiPauneto]
MMKSFNKSRVIAAAMPLDGDLPFTGRPVRAARAIPRRDPNGHGDGNGNGDGNGDDDDDGNGEPTPVDVKGSPEYKALATEAQKHKDDLATLRAELEELKNKDLPEDERQRAAEVATKVSEAVSAKEVELTDLYETRIAKLHDEIIDSTIDSVFAGGSLDKKDFVDIIATLDKAQFVTDDGTVDREKIKRVLTPITKAATSRPPRTSGVARVAQNNGFGRYLKQD